MRNVILGLRCVLFVLMLALTACVQPVTHFQYVPPASESGKQCIQACYKSGQECKRLCPPTNPMCQCMEDYRACYQLCGGKVEEQREWETN